jgi:two-component system sensor kinase FixL
MTTSARYETSSSLDALMDTAPDAIIIIDGNGLIRRFNRSARQIFGYTEDEMLQRNVSMLMPEPFRSNHDGYISAYRESGVARIIGTGREVTGQRKSGETFPMFLSVGKAGRADELRFVGIVRDLSEQRAIEEMTHRLEAQLLHADRLVVLGELTAGIAHEINQPLTAIAAYADAGRALCHRGLAASEEEIHQICQRISEQSRRAASVVHRLRKLVRGGTVSKARHDINKIIKNISVLFDYEIKKSGTSLIMIPSEHACDLYVDEIQIQQILVNLVKNSLDSIAESGMSDGRIEIAVEVSGADLELTVSDNGSGVPEDLHKRLFEPFFTTKPKGVGLGLSICKTIATAHGGNLTFEIPDSGGSRFRLRLPMEHIG